MNDPPDDPPCPSWCVTHVDGRHVAELTLAHTQDTFNIYLRPVDYGDGQVGLEVVVADPNGTKTSRVDLGPDEVKESAWLGDLRHTFARWEADTDNGKQQ